MIEKEALDIIFEEVALNSLHKYLEDNPNIIVCSRGNINLFKGVLLQFCNELNKKLNIGASSTKPLTDKQKTRFNHIVDDCIRLTFRNFKDVTYNCNIRFSKSNILILTETMNLTIINLCDRINVKLKRSEKRL